MRRRTQQAGRTGFTLVELLVAMALIIFIMYVLTEAFSAGAKAFRDLKAIGDMNARLRTATSLLRRYLAADHFEGRKRLSDLDFWKEGPPKEGFFRIWQGDAGVDEGADLDGGRSYRTTTHHLHFTTRLRGNHLGDYFHATVPAGSPLLSLPFPDSRFQDPSPANQIFHSPWAEIALYLVPTGETTEDPNAATLNPTAPGTPLALHTLFLRQRLLVPSNDDLTAAVPVGQASQYLEVSQTVGAGNNANLYFNNSADVTMPVNRFGNQTPRNQPVALAHPTSPGSYPTFQTENNALSGSDVLLTDVLSMDIRVLLGRECYPAGQPERFVSLFDGSVTQYEMGNPAFGGAKVFDTWSGRKDETYDYGFWDVRSTDNPLPPGYNAANDQVKVIPLYRNTSGTKIRIRALQITLRIWDSRTKQSRQVSLVQDL